MSLPRYRDRARKRSQRVLFSLGTALGIALAIGRSDLAYADGDRAAEADALFAQGVKLLEDNHLGEACAKFVASHQLEPSFGALFNLGDCHERAGRRAAAWTAFHDAEVLAGKTDQQPRSEKAARRTAALAPHIVRLTVQIARAEPPPRVTIDDQVIAVERFGQAIAVEVGEHRIVATAPASAGQPHPGRYRPWSLTLVLREPGATSTVKIPALEVLADATPATVRRDASDAGARSGLGIQRTVALVVGGVGVASLIAGITTGALTIKKWNDALSHCDDRQVCDAEGGDLGRQARATAHASTATFVIAGAAAATALALWFTAQPVRDSRTRAVRDSRSRAVRDSRSRAVRDSHTRAPAPATILLHASTTGVTVSVGF